MVNGRMERRAKQKGKGENGTVKQQMVLATFLTRTLALT